MIKNKLFWSTFTKYSKYLCTYLKRYEINITSQKKTKGGNHVDCYDLLSQLDVKKSLGTFRIEVWCKNGKVDETRFSII